MNMYALRSVGLFHRRAGHAMSVLLARVGRPPSRTIAMVASISLSSAARSRLSLPLSNSQSTSQFVV